MQPWVNSHRDEYDSLGVFTVKQEHGSKMSHDYHFICDFAFCHIINMVQHATMLTPFGSLWSVYLLRLFYYLSHFRYISLTQIQYSIGSVQNVQWNSGLKCNHVYTHIAIDMILLDYLPLDKSMAVKYSVIIFAWDFTFLPYNRYGTVFDHVKALHVHMVCVLS